ncbi:MAG: YbbR-like domain-containing protein [Bacillota bacterium]
MKLTELAKRLQKCLCHRLPLKIIAFVLALLLFFAANAEREAQSENEMINRAVLVDLVTENQEQGYAPINLAKKVEVLVQTPKGTTVSNDLTASINLHGRAAGEYTIPVHVYLPKGWKLLEVRPQSVSVKIEPIETRRFVVTLIFPDGSQMKNTVVLQCNVQGPSSIVKQVRAVTGFVDNDLMGPADVRLTPVDRDGWPVSGAAVFPEWVRIDPLSGMVESSWEQVDDADGDAADGVGTTGGQGATSGQGTTSDQGTAGGNEPGNALKSGEAGGTGENTL